MIVKDLAERIRKCEGKDVNNLGLALYLGGFSEEPRHTDSYLMEDLFRRFGRGYKKAEPGVIAIWKGMGGDTTSTMINHAATVISLEGELEVPQMLYFSEQSKTLERATLPEIIEMRSRWFELYGLR